MAAAAYFQSVSDNGVLEDLDACIDHLVGLGIPTQRIGVDRVLLRRDEPPS